jgi:hypothetical protein
MHWSAMLVITEVLWYIKYIVIKVFKCYSRKETNVHRMSESRFLCNFAFETENDINLIKVQIYDRDSWRQKYYAK